jgi:hypothetical protein
MQSLSNPNSDIAAAIGQFVEALVRIHEPERDLIRAIDSELGWLESRDSNAAEQHQAWVSFVSQRLGERHPPVPDPLASAHLLISTVEHLSRWMAHSAPSGVERRLLIGGLERMVRGLLDQRV